MNESVHNMCAGSFVVYMKLKKYNKKQFWNMD